MLGTRAHRARRQPRTSRQTNISTRLNRGPIGGGRSGYVANITPGPFAGPLAQRQQRHACTGRRLGRGGRRRSQRTTNGPLQVQRLSFSGQVPQRAAAPATWCLCAHLRLNHTTPTPTPRRQPPPPPPPRQRPNQSLHRRPVQQFVTARVYTDTFLSWWHRQFLLPDVPKGLYLMTDTTPPGHGKFWKQCRVSGCVTIPS